MNVSKYLIDSIVEDEVINLKFLKKSLWITHDHDDALLRQILESAIYSAENYMKVNLQRRRVFADVRNYQGDHIILPVTPASRVEKITSINKDSDAKNITLSRGDVDLKKGKIYLNKNYHNHEIKIIYLTGYDKLPAPIIQGILIHACEIYDQQNLFLSINDIIADFYRPYRGMRLR